MPGPSVRPCTVRSTFDPMCMWHVACGRPRRPAVPSVGGHCDCGALTSSLARALTRWEQQRTSQAWCNATLDWEWGWAAAGRRRGGFPRQPHVVNRCRQSISPAAASQRPGCDQAATRLRSMETKRKPLRRSFLPVLPPSGGTGSQLPAPKQLRSEVVQAGTSLSPHGRGLGSLRYLPTSFNRYF